MWHVSAISDTQFPISVCTAIFGAQPVIPYWIIARLARLRAYGRLISAPQPTLIIQLVSIHVLMAISRIKRHILAIFVTPHAPHA